MIPNLIQFAWEESGPPMPDWAADNIEQFRRLNPDWEVRVHGEDVLLDEYRDIYARITDVCTKSDLLAFSGLQRYGGWFLDCDYWPFRPMADIVRGWDVDGSRMFITEQHGQRNQSLRIANGIMAATTDWPGWAEVRKAVHALKPPYQRCDFGPVMMTKLVDEQPDLFTVGGWPFFYPAAIGYAVRIYKKCKAHPEIARGIAPTGRQLPLMLHLWAGGRCTLDPGKDPGLIAALEGRPGGPYAGRTAICAFLKIQWDDTTQPFRAVAEGLAQIGYAVEVRAPEESLNFDAADLVVIWNGRHDPARQVMARVRTAGIRRLVMEHGFFDRRAYVHVDPKDILHWASWAKD